MIHTVRMSKQIELLILSNLTLLVDSKEITFDSNAITRTQNECFVHRPPQIPDKNGMKRFFISN